MAKIPPKRFAILCHKLAVLCELQLDLIQEINPEADGFIELKEGLKKIKPKLEEIVESAFEVEDIYRGRYFQDLSAKVDTLLRKEYQFFPQKQKT